MHDMTRMDLHMKYLVCVYVFKGVLDIYKWLCVLMSTFPQRKALKLKFISMLVQAGLSWF